MECRAAPRRTCVRRLSRSKTRLTQARPNGVAPWIGTPWRQSGGANGKALLGVSTRHNAQDTAPDYSRAAQRNTKVEPTPRAAVGAVEPRQRGRDRRVVSHFAQIAR